MGDKKYLFGPLDRWPTSTKSQNRWNRRRMSAKDIEETPACNSTYIKISVHEDTPQGGVPHWSERVKLGTFCVTSFISTSHQRQFRTECHGTEVLGREVLLHKWNGIRSRENRKKKPNLKQILLTLHVANTQEMVKDSPNFKTQINYARYSKFPKSFKR